MITILQNVYIQYTVPTAYDNTKSVHTFFFISSCSFFVTPFLIFIEPMLNAFNLFSDIVYKHETNHTPE